MQVTDNTPTEPKFPEDDRGRRCRRVAQCCVRCAAKLYDAIGTTTDNGLREGRIGPQRLTHNGQNKQDIKTETVAFDPGRVKTTTLTGGAKSFLYKFRVTKTDYASEYIRLDAVFENYIFYIFRLYEFSLSLGPRTTCAVEWGDEIVLAKFRGQPNAARNLLNARGSRVACQCDYNAK